MEIGMEMMGTLKLAIPMGTCIIINMAFKTEARSREVAEVAAEKEYAAGEEAYGAAEMVALVQLSLSTTGEMRFRSWI
jgi:hypothetical protein